MSVPFYRIVTPYRPFAAEVHSDEPAFNWVDAIGMLRASARASCGLPVDVLTDRTTRFPWPALRYDTSSTRLQHWLTEIRLAYLRSDAFNCPTLLVSPDMLICEEVWPLFESGADLGLPVRLSEKFGRGWKRIMNSAQWWRPDAKTRLIAFYEEAWQLSAALPEELQRWGGDTEVLCQLLDPMKGYGIFKRRGLRVDLVPMQRVLHPLTTAQINDLEAGRPLGSLHAPILDFKYTRKRYMRQAFDEIFSQAVA